MAGIPSEVEVVVVGGGQAGIAASEHLHINSIPHVVIEKDRVAESWRTRRWDSLVANGPAWHDKFPSLDFSGDQDAFASKEDVVSYMEKYAQQIDMPVHTGESVASVKRREKAPGFVVETLKGQKIKTRYVISATGAFQTPLMPNIIPEAANIHQMHSIYYKSPAQLAAGNVLVVGAGSSGAQIADELSLAQDGRKVFLSVGPHDRPPRSYRGRDFCWWLGVLNKWDMEAEPGSDHTTIAVSGARGGETMDFRRLAKQGVVLLGRTNEFRDGSVVLGQDLQTNVAKGDENYLSVLREADKFIEDHGLDLPEEPAAHKFLPDPECLKTPLKVLDLKENNITTVIWATGFNNDYGWLGETKAVSQNGRPCHTRGVSVEPGVYFLGLPWQTRRGSSFIWGVWYDAKYVVDHIVKQKRYMQYRPNAVIA